MIYTCLVILNNSDVVNQTVEAGKNRRRILDRLKEMGLDYETSEAELEKLQKDFASKKVPFKGVEFDPFLHKQLPDPDQLY